MDKAFAGIAFTPSVQDIQKKMGSAEPYAKFLAGDAECAGRLGDAEAEFISRRDGFYQASISETGWPYVQFRGGPPGFLRVLDDRTIAYADFRGNRQYVSAGNITADDRLSLILMDYPNRRRLKIWGRAGLVDMADDPGLIQRLHDKQYRAKPERAVVIKVEAFDWNCPQHIPQRLTLDELEPLLAPMREEILQLREENRSLKDWLGRNTGDVDATGGS